ncbi:FAS1-like dehydratase domain-containing protein [Ramlibacter sp.]|uniref:FAS1-like dehydratase domain-containing protein n=1 Tax=Ramlibacter sp. TaxID=1917967 RepID=UPI003D0DADC5
MTDTLTSEKPASGYGILTDDGIARLRQRIGVQYRKPQPPHNYEVTWDGSRHFAFGYGDDNPLWCDRDYGATTRWGGLIAPPNFLYTMGDPVTPKHTPEEKALLKGDPMIGLGSYQSQMEFEWWRPLKVGDTLKRHTAIVGVRVNEDSKFAGRSVAEVHAFIYPNQNGELHAIRRGTWVRAERHATAARKKEVQLPEPYTEAQLKEIDACYEAETIRGAQTRYWEDVQVGESLQTIVRGPMRTSDLIIWHMGWGMQLTPPGAFRLSYQLRKKIPGMFTPNAMNVPDTVQRLHWEKEWANELGIPVSYDYGALRETFLTNIVTNWMGDDGWLWKMTCQHRKFVYTNDTYWIKGKVTDKVQAEGRNEVHLDIWVENQWGVNVSPGSAVVLLPTREAAVDLPRPAEEDIDAMIRHEVRRHA